MCSHGQIFHRPFIYFYIEILGNFYSARSWLSGKRYTFVNNELIPLIQEKCKSTDKPSSDKKKSEGSWSPLRVL